MAFKMSQEFQTTPWILPKIFLFYTVLTHTFVIPSAKQKHTTGSLTHTHTRPATTTNKKQLGTSHRLLMVTLAQKLLSCAKFQSLRVIKKYLKKYNFADIGLAAGFAPTKECFKRSRWFGKRHKTDAFTRPEGTYYQSCMYPHRQYLAGISNAFSASFTSIWPSFPRFYCIPTKRAYSALHPQELTECSPLDFRRSSILSHN